MNNEPGPLMSPHGDSEPYEQTPLHRDPHRSDSDNTGPEAESPGRSRLVSEPTERRSAAPGYGQQQPDGTATPADPAPPLPAVTSADQPLERELSRPDTMKIGIWGSPGSGKSTFLVALQHATVHAHPSLGRWVLYPLTDQSKELLVQWNQQLVAERRFPEATDLATVTELRWRFRGQPAASRHQPPWRRWRRVREESTFDLDLIDVSGEVFGPRPTEKNVPVYVVTRTLEHLANAQGLLFLFDPIAELNTPVVASYMNRTLVELLGTAESRGQIRGGYLPQHIAVCVTKFDHPLLFQQARRAGLVNSGLDGRPRVLDEHARLFFDALCEGRFWEDARERGTDGPRFVREMLRQHFHPARTQYYVTSSIGFQLRADGQFDPARYAMVREQEEGQRITGPIDPINVLEPLVELHMKLRGDR